MNVAEQQISGGSRRDDWQTTTLGDACRRSGGDIQTGPFGSQLHAADYVSDGIPTIMPLNIGDNRVLHEGIARITKEDARRLSKYRVRKGDIVYSRRGDIERRALIREDEEGWLCGTGCLRVRFGDDYVDPVYVSYYLGHKPIRDWLINHAVGTSMANLNTSILSALPFNFPPISKQHRIAEILGSLDDMIELNRRMSRTLEKLARAVFKAWFVDFLPVKAKRDGAKSFPGMDAETFALFPDSFEQSAIGEIPRSWRVSTIGTEVSVVGGGTPSTANPDFWDGEHRWVTPRDLSRLNTPVLLDTERRITDAGIRQISSGLLPIGTVLLSSRAPIGYVAITEMPVAINQGFIAMICDKELPKEFIWLWLLENMETIIGRANGTTFLEISKTNFRPIPLVVAGASVLESFTRTVRSLWDLLVSNEIESRSLTETRDLLLPRLLSGQCTDTCTGAEESRHLSAPNPNSNRQRNSGL